MASSKHVLDDSTVEVYDYTNGVVRKSYSSFMLFFRERMLPSMCKLSDKIRNNRCNYLFSQHFSVFLPTELTLSVEWITFEHEFNQLLAVSFLNNILKQYRKNSGYVLFYNENDDENDYDNPTKLVIVDSESEYMRFSDWYSQKSRLKDLIHKWFTDVGNAIMRQYGYCLNDTHYKIYVIRKYH